RILPAPAPAASRWGREPLCGLRNLVQAHSLRSLVEVDFQIESQKGQYFAVLQVGGVRHDVVRTARDEFVGQSHHAALPVPEPCLPWTGIERLGFACAFGGRASLLDAGQAKR